MKKERKLAIRIMEAIADKLDNPSFFDNSEHRLLEYLSNEPIEPDGTWFAFEDLITNLLEERTKND